MEPQSRHHTGLGTIIAEVERILNLPDATADDLERAKDMVEAANRHDKNNTDCDTKSGKRTMTKGGRRPPRAPRPPPRCGPEQTHERKGARPEVDLRSTWNALAQR